MVFIFLWFIGFLPLIFSFDITKKSDIATAIECPCDVTADSCDYHCCCDTSCNSVAGDWRDDKTNDNSNPDKVDNVCIDEQSSFNRIEYSCVDSNLILKYNKKRGMIDGIKDNNLCVMMDNDNYGNTYYKTLQDDFKIEEDLNKITENIFQNHVRNIIESQTPTDSMGSSTDYLIFPSEDNIFVHQKVFSIYSPDPYGFCTSYKKILRNKSTSTECYKKDLSYSEVESAIQALWTIQNDKVNRTNCGGQNTNELREVEIIFKPDYTAYSLYISCLSLAGPIKFSVVFRSEIEEDISKMPLPRSGNEGYLVGYPLNIKYCSTTNDCKFYKGGFRFTCENQKSFDILYGFDSEIQCSIKPDKRIFLNNLVNISRIGHFGASDENRSDWLNFGLAEKMKSIYGDDIDAYPLKRVINYLAFIGEGGFETNPQEYVSRTSYLELGEDADQSVLFKIKFIKMKKSLFSEEVSMPTILPRLPKDLVEPFLRPEI